MSSSCRRQNADARPVGAPASAVTQPAKKKSSRRTKTGTVSTETRVASTAEEILNELDDTGFDPSFRNLEVNQEKHPPHIESLPAATHPTSSSASSHFHLLGDHPPPPPAMMPSSNVPPPSPSRADLTTANPYATLPPGWSTAVNAADGRVYFWEAATGRTSWTHPWAGQSRQARVVEPGLFHQLGSQKPVFDSNTRYDDSLLPHQENPNYASKRPDSSECSAFVALFLCLPLGIMAVYHSLSTNRAWNDGRYGDAVHHARQAPRYATLGNVLGIIFWMYMLFFREPGGVDWEWPNWEGWGDR
jgi:hypothetical protein